MRTPPNNRRWTQVGRVSSSCLKKHPLHYPFENPVLVIKVKKGVFHWITTSRRRTRTDFFCFTEKNPSLSVKRIFQNRPTRLWCRPYNFCSDDFKRWATYLFELIFVLTPLLCLENCCIRHMLFKNVWARRCIGQKSVHLKRYKLASGCFAFVLRHVYGLVFVLCCVFFFFFGLFLAVCGGVFCPVVFVLNKFFAFVYTLWPTGGFLVDFFRFVYCCFCSFFHFLFQPQQGGILFIL